MTLVEVVVASALLMLGLAAIYQAMTYSMYVRQQGHHVYTGAVIANNRVELARNLSFGNLSELAETEVAVDAAGVPNDEGPYHRTTIITQPYDGVASLAQVDVQVAVPTVWGGGGVLQTAQVTTLLYNMEP